MRDDLVGMLKNAIDHGGNPSRVAQSLINSGYPIKDVREAYDYVIKNNPNLQENQENQKQQTPQQYKAPTQTNQIQTLKPLKPLPSQKTNPSGNGKIIALIIILALLVISLIATIIFKDELLDLLSL